MSPAGFWPQLHAAIEAGADAVYLGLSHFSARAKTGFSLADLPEVMRTLHQRGVKGYVTFNTLVFDSEMETAASTLAAIADAGADSIIVQDLGIVTLAKRIAPDLDVHGSTQMSVTNADGVALAQSLGVSRVVMARELSLDDLRAIRTATDCEMEIFVHGALCVSYSGQCLSSEAWGGRSANRGQCAQACRLPYEMIVDGTDHPLADARYLLSPGDLYALKQIPEICEIGISALKIEGRYKEAEYVALTTRAYRQAVDEAWAGLPLSATPADELRLEQVYSRGLGPYFVSGVNHQNVVRGRSPRHRGVMMGSVTKLAFDAVVVAPSAAHAIAPVKAGDGIVFDAADWRSPQEREEGGRVYEVTPIADGLLELRFRNSALNFANIRPGDLVWRSHDYDVDKAAKPYLQPGAPVARQIVNVRAVVREGEPLTAEWSLAKRPSTRTQVASDRPLGEAKNRPVSAGFIRDQFSRLGDTPYELGELTVDLAGNPFAPSSILNTLRRQAVEALQEIQGRAPSPAARDIAVETPQAPKSADTAARLHLLVRSPDQLDAAIALRPASITLDYLDLYGLRPSVEKGRASGVEIRVASPRVLKPGEEGIAEFLIKLGCPILVRPAGLLRSLAALRGHPPLTGDFSLNAANAITARMLLDYGIARLTPSHDLNAAQVAELARSVGGGALEMVAYHHLPVFHTEHCVFCRFLSTGTSYRDCGRPCESHRVALRDENGREHPLMADVGCRNTVFGAEAQDASQYIGEWREAGISHFRLEFVHESPELVTRIATAYSQALSGAITCGELTHKLDRMVPQGITEGSLFVPKQAFPVPILQ